MTRKVQTEKTLQLLDGFACTFALAGLLIVGTARPLAAQSQPEKEKQTFPAAAEGTPTPKPAPEGFKLGDYEGHADFEIGYRWTSDIRGSLDVYRSMVNLGDGPRLLNADLSLRAPYGSGRFVDHFDLSLNNWGGDPYNTMRLSLGRTDKFEFTADYRNLNYFNYLPTWSSPLLQQGSLLGQHSTDITWRTTNLELRLFPNHKISPYIAYSRNTGVDFGVTPNFTTYEATGNEFVLFNHWLYSADDYRGGVQVALPKFVLTLEQGWRLLKNDTGVNGPVSTTGNTGAPFLGQPIILNSASRGYHDRTTLPVSKAVVKFQPLHNLKITGRYIYTVSTLESNLGEIDIGNLVNQEARLIFNTSSDTFNTRAKEPNHLGSFVIEYLPFSRLTLLDHFETRSMHVSGDAILNTAFFGNRTLAGNVPTSNQTLQDILNTLITYDRIENQAEFEFDVGHGLVAHAGHRYTTADTSIFNPGDQVPDYASFSRQTALAGFYFTRGQWLHLALDYEKNTTNGALTRTSLLNYDRFKFDWRVGSWKHISANGRVAFLRNSNPQPDVDWHDHNKDYSVGLNYSPSDRYYVSLDYARSTILSDLLIILPFNFQNARSLFDERTQGLGATVGIGLYRGSKIEFGYRGILNVGSFPLNYHQPFAGITIPLPGHLAYKTYWSWYGYNEKNSDLQDFRRHLVVFSLAYNY